MDFGLEKILEGKSEHRIYMRVLDKYCVPWDLEKAARDTWQNFFDANNGTLDGASVEINQEEEEYVIRIRGGSTIRF